jgi:hypothetical protein
VFRLPDADEILALALAEDLGVPAARLQPGPRPARADEEPLLARDVTSSSVVAPDAIFEGRVVAREA